MIVSLKIKQIYDKYKLSRIVWYGGCSPNGMEKTYLKHSSLHDIKNYIVDRLKSNKKNYANIFINGIWKT